jgi:hypothetical protein
MVKNCRLIFFLFKLLWFEQGNFSEKDVLFSLISIVVWFHPLMGDNFSYKLWLFRLPSHSILTFLQRGIQAFKDKVINQWKFLLISYISSKNLSFWITTTSTKNKNKFLIVELIKIKPQQKNFRSLHQQSASKWTRLSCFSLSWECLSSLWRLLLNLNPLRWNTSKEVGFTKYRLSK